MPSLPVDKSEDKIQREIIDEIKLVADYCNLSITDALDLPFDLFALSLKKAFIRKLESSEKGRELLKLSEYMERTDCDLDLLLDFYGDEE